MEYQKITILLGHIPDKAPKVFTKNWIEVHDQSGKANDRYKPRKQKRFLTSMLQWDLSDYSDVCILVKETITVTRENDNAYDKTLAFKNIAPFISCISKINNTLTDNAEDVDIVMPIHNLIEYSKNYSESQGSLCNYYRDESNSRVWENDINYSIKCSKSFNYKTRIVGKLEGSNTEQNVEIVVQLKYLSEFWRTLDITLINCEVCLTLTWPRNYVITNKAFRQAFLVIIIGLELVIQQTQYLK